MKPTRIETRYRTMAAAMLLLVVAPLLTPVAIPGVTQVRRNSEAFFFVFLVVVEMATTRRPEVRWAWRVSLLLGFAVTLLPGIPGAIETLGEAVMAALVFSLHLQLADSPGSALRRWLVPVAAALIALAGSLPMFDWLGNDLRGWIVTNAEAWGFLILTALTHHLVTDRSLSRDAVIGYLIALVVIPVGVAILNANGVDPSGASGFVEHLMVWIQRITEAFIANFLLVIFFYWIAPVGPQPSGTSSKKRSAPD